MAQGRLNNNNNTVRLILTAIGTLILLAGILIAVGGLRGDICANKEDISTLRPTVTDNREQIIEWRTTLNGFIQEQRTFNAEQKQVNRRILEKLDDVASNP